MTPPLSRSLGTEGDLVTCMLPVATFPRGGKYGLQGEAGHYTQLPYVNFYMVKIYKQPLCGTVMPAATHKWHRGVDKSGLGKQKKTIPATDKTYIENRTREMQRGYERL